MSSEFGRGTITANVLVNARKEHETWINNFLLEIKEKAKYDETKKKKAIRELQKHLSHELAEMTEESRKTFFETAMNKIFDLMVGVHSALDVKCGVMLMCILLDAILSDTNKPQICAPFANHLRNVNLNVYDLELLDLMACAVGKIALNSGSSAPNFVDFEIREAREAISSVNYEIAKRHSAILIIRELANVTSSLFFKHVLPCFENIFQAIDEPKLREPAISALRAMLNVVVEREKLAWHTLPVSSTKSSIRQIDIQIPQCFKTCFDKVTGVFQDYKDGNLGKQREDKIHTALLILNELLRCSQESSDLFKDPFSDEIDFSDINTFDLSQYLFMHFDRPVISSGSSVSSSASPVNHGASANVGAASSMTTSSSSSTLNRLAGATASAAGERAAEPTGTASSYLSKLFRNNSNAHNKPLFKRDLSSLVNYHKENGKAPVFTFFHKGRQMSTSISCKELIKNYYDQICQDIRSLMTNKNIEAVNQVLLILLPSLVQLQPKRFCEHDDYVRDSIDYLISMIKLPNLRSLAYIALGLFTLSILSDDAKRDRNEPTKFDVYIEKIMKQIRAAFIVKDGKKRSNPDPAVFICIGFLAQAFGEKIEKEIRDMLPTLFSLGLTEPLANSLYNICKYISSLEMKIHQNLLELLNNIIFNNQMNTNIIGNSGSSEIIIEAYDTESLDALPSLPPPTMTPVVLFNVPETVSTETLKLALKVLGRFIFTVNISMKFARQCAHTYLTHDNRAIRLEAVHTCCHLLKPSLKSHGGAIDIIQDVLQSLLLVGITDVDKNVRYSVLSRLDENFDYFISSQILNLSLLQMSINDEVFEIRELGICIIGRICALNPAYVMPFLRQHLLNYLNELENAGVAKNMEQSARMLGHILSATPRLIRPFTGPLIKVFLPKLNEPSQAVTTAVISAIGEQAIVSGLEMRSYFDELFPFLLEAIQDPNPFQKREVALLTLGRFIENCGFVIEPYWKYPALLDILFNNLKIDSTKTSMLIRQETIRVLGLLGAVDPYRHKVNLGEIDLSGESLISCDPLAEQQVNFQELVSAMNNFDDYYSGQAIEILVRVMKDPNLSAQHTMAVQAVDFIFSVIKGRSVQYLPHVLPPFLNIIRCGEAKIKEFLLQQLAVIISVVRTQIRSYLDDIFKVLRELWNSCTPVNPTMQITLFNVVDQIVLSLDGDFRNYVPHLIPHIMRVLNHDPSRNKEVTKKLLLALQNFGPNLEGYVNLFVPPIVKLFHMRGTQDNKADTDVPTLAMLTICSFCDDLRLSDFATLIVHSLLKVISEDNVSNKVVTVAMDTLTKFAREAGDHYKMYIPLVAKTLERSKVVHAQYEVLVRNIQAGVSLEEVKLSKPRRKRMFDLRKQPDRGDSKRLPITFTGLQNLFNNETSKKISKEDWLEWLSELNIYLIKNSPSLSLQACYPIAVSSSLVARELFNPAFLSFWYELTAEDQKRMVKLIENALLEQEIPEVTLILLNLAEFLERIDLTATGCEIFDAKILANRALRCRSYAKALHYKEKEFGPDASTEVFGALISINNKLQADFAAYGVLNLALQKCKGIDYFEVKEKWFEKLGNWVSALQAYRQRSEQNPRDFDPIVGQMRCLEELSEWDELYCLASDTFPEAEDANRQQMARIAANASWNLNKWDDMVNYAQHISNDSFDSYFLRAVITIHQGHYSLAQFSIDKARQLIDSELTSLAGESYNRAYQTMIQVQLFSELEEVIHYKLVPERRDMIKQKWWIRLQGVRKNVEDWQKILQVHSLVLSPKEDIRSWLKFTKLCDRFQRHDLTLKTIGRIFGGNPIKMLKRTHSANLNLFSQPLMGEATMRLIDHIWEKEYYRAAFVYLHKLIDVYEKPLLNMAGSGGPAQFLSGSADSGLEVIPSSMTGDMRAAVGGNGNNQAIINKLLSRAYFKLGDWSHFIYKFTLPSIRSILEFHRKATEYDSNWYKAWHTWAYMNFRALNRLKSKNPELVTNLESTAHNNLKQGIHLNAKEFCRSAVKGFFAAIRLAGHEASLQDTLRVLTLWFEDGHDDQVRAEVEAGIKSVSIETWLQVIPQLIARIDANHPEVAKLIHQLLADIGKSHPQALIYPLTVASKSSTQARRRAATNILQLMRVHSPNLVKQAVLVSEELIRIAILWHELWHEGLEEASRLYFGEKNIEGMLNTLEPLHQMILQAAITYKELTFVQNYGVELDKAYALCKGYRQSKDIKLLNQAWDVYYHVFRKISRQLNQLTSLELQYVSPKLGECIDLELAVPGSYSPHQKDQVIKIARVEPQLSIITSKQRPRKLTIKGSNGMNYMFLLKGHEDLRQDERVMQLFGLVNMLLNKNINTTNRNLSIQRYAVIPLSPNSGLIGWVPHCDTLHSLIRDYREKKKVLLNMEHRLMLRMAPDYDRLLLMGKVEVFEHALDNTPGNDLAKIMWLKSPNSEVWFERRTNYTRSLAVMSMVGYILGLGDRHPSNLMLDQKSGKILHIDFGDCFEVAMTREKYPEKIPFRLTRMLVKAMEVAGVEGTFRVTAAQVLTVLRVSRQSLMALLEAFVYDPLLNWRLQEIQNPRGIKMQTTAAAAAPANNEAFPIEGLEYEVGADEKLHTKRINNKPPLGGEFNKTNEAASSETDSKEGQNKKALEVIKRVRDKLNGKDFRKIDTKWNRIPVYDQVAMLIQQATSHENLCQCYIGWCPFW